MQVASIGLLKGIDRYDPARRYAFSSFRGADDPG
jgi:DNA-directed RNA polymerase specialized sigma subunit